MTIGNNEEYPIEFNEVIVEIVDRQLVKQKINLFEDNYNFRPNYNGEGIDISPSYGKQKDSNNYDFKFRHNFSEKYLQRYINLIKSLNLPIKAIGISKNAIAFMGKDLHIFPVKNSCGFFIHKDLTDEDLLTKLDEGITNLHRSKQ